MICRIVFAIGPRFGLGLVHVSQAGEQCEKGGTGKLILAALWAFCCHIGHQLLWTPLSPTRVGSASFRSVLGVILFSQSMYSAQCGSRAHEVAELVHVAAAALERLAQPHQRAHRDGGQREDLPEW